MPHSLLPGEPCRTCESHDFWLDGLEWRCSHCEPATVQYPITLRLNLCRESEPAPEWRDSWIAPLVATRRAPVAARKS